MIMLYISLIIAVLDQVTKYAVVSHVLFKEQIVLIPGLFNLTYVRNTGAAWGIFAGFGNMLILFSFIMLFGMIFLRRYIFEDILLHKVSMGLILAGIVGNLIDRIRLGYVVDFIDFHWRSGYHFPAFNVADSSICVGVFFYIFSAIIAGRKSHEGTCTAVDK